MRINYPNNNIDNLDITNLNSINSELTNVNSTNLSATNITTVGLTGTNVKTTTLNSDTILIKGDDIQSSLFKEETDWTIVSNVTELENALADKKRNIFLKSGPTYYLNSIIVLYDNLKLVGESVPSNEGNTHNDGVKLYRSNGIVETPTDISILLNHPCTTPNRGDKYINCDALTVDIPAGSLVTIDQETHLINEDASIGATRIYIEDNIYSDNITGTTFNIYQPSVKNITIENILVDTNDNTEAIWLSRVVGAKLRNISSIDNGYQVIEFKYSTHLEVSEIRSNYYDDDALSFYSCTLFKCDLLGRSFRGGSYPRICTVSYCGNFIIENNRGGGISVGSSFNFRLVNNHASENNANSSFVISSCAYFTIDGCSSGEDDRPFYIPNSYNFVIENCNAPNASPGNEIYLSGSRNYRLNSNIWQDNELELFNQTTDDTLLDLLQLTDIELPSLGAIGFKVSVIAVQSGGTAGVIGTAKYIEYNGLMINDGTTTFIDNVVSENTFNEMVGSETWGLDFRASGNSLMIQTMGELNKTINWKIKINTFKA